MILLVDRNAKKTEDTAIMVVEALKLQDELGIKLNQKIYTLDSFINLF